METYYSLNLYYKKLSEKISNYDDININQIINLKKKIFIELNNLKRELSSLNDNKYTVFNNLMKNYFSLLNNCNFYSDNSSELFKKLLSNLDDIIINKIFKLDSNNKNLKDLESKITKNIEKVNKNKNYLFFELYNFNNNSIKSIEFSKVKNYYIYCLLNQKEKSNNFLIDNIESIHNLDKNNSDTELLNLLNLTFKEINSFELLNFYELFNQIKSNYQELINKSKSLDILINRNILKINDCKFFNFTISKSNLYDSYNDIIDYIEIKKKNLENLEDFESFKVFYKIFTNINNKLDICEEDLSEIKNKEITILDKIKYIEQEINRKNREIINLNKKKNNNSKRIDKIKLILNKNSIIENDNDLNLENKLNDKIIVLKSTINSQISKIYRIDSLLEKKKYDIEQIMKKLGELKNQKEIMYERYKLKFNDANEEKKEFINIKDRLEEELTYNKNNLILLEENLNKLTFEENKGDFDVKIDIENIDNQISITKEKENKNKNEILSLSKDKEELKIELEINKKKKMKLLKRKNVLDDDLYNNQAFLKSKFNYLFNEKYHIDNIKTILKNLILDIEKKKVLEESIDGKYNYDIIFQELNNYQNQYTFNYEKIVKNIENIKKFKKNYMHSNKQNQKIFISFIDDITFIIELFYHLRTDLHNFFYIKHINNYIIKNETNLNLNDIIYNNKLNDILIEEEQTVINLKSNILKLKNHILKEKENKKKELTNKYYNLINDNVISCNKLSKENLIINKIKNSINNLRHELDSIYNYLISSI